MSYAIHEMFPTLQGEGYHAGTPAVFIRFAGCNYWSGNPAHRETSECPFCDTEFRGTGGRGGGRLSAQEIATQARSMGAGIGWAVCTGGEPLLQLDSDVVDALHAEGFKVAVETNGSVELCFQNRMGIDWVCCSPKSSKRQRLKWADELKVVYPAQPPEEWRNLVNARHLFVQPMDGDKDTRERATEQAIRFVMDNPDWRLSVQTHKDVGLP
tara:strand:- start:55 stop:690 length:636 start_codon:yes stop_codon:yes gene_type:complete